MGRRGTKSHRMYPYFDEVVRPVRSNEPESYAGRSLATDRACYGRQVKRDEQTQRDTLVGWGLGVWPATRHRKKSLPSKMLTQLKPDRLMYDNISNPLRITLRESK